jgi:hypothetical protein
MLGAGLQFNRSRNGEDRFYSAARARRSRNQSQSRDHLRRAQSDVAVRPSQPLLNADSRLVANEQSKSRKAKPETGVLTARPVVPPTPPVLCNLEQLLESVIPSVPAQYLSKVLLLFWI